MNGYLIDNAPDVKSRASDEWALAGSNCRPLPCEDSALTN